MESLEGILAEHPFFSGLEPRYLQLAVGCASNVRFNAGESFSKLAKKPITSTLFAQEGSGSKSSLPAAAA